MCRDFMELSMFEIKKICKNLNEFVDMICVFKCFAEKKILIINERRKY